MSRPIVVVGGGHNGLTAATYLAQAGHRVVLVEERPTLGGLARRHSFHPGFSVPGLLHDTAQLQEPVVRDLGLRGHGLAWRRPPAVWVPHDKDRGGLWLRQGRVEGDISAEDAGRYAAFRDFIKRIAPVITQVMQLPPPDPHGAVWPLIKTGWGLRKLGPRDMTELLRVGPMPVSDWLSDSFDHPALRAAVALEALEGSYMAPRSPGSSGNLLLRAGSSSDEVVGGPAALIDALEKAARERGVTIKTGVRVQQIVLDKTATEVVGVALSDGERIETGRVLTTCDPKAALLGLVGSRYLPAHLAGDLGNIRTRGITAKLHLALSGALETPDGERVEAMRVAGHMDEIERAFNPVKYGEVGRRPALDVRVPSMSDPSLCATEGQHVASIVAYYAPHTLRDGGWTQEARAQLTGDIVTRLAEHVPGLRDRILASELFTPADIEARYGVAGGHTHHGEHALDQLLFMRPTMACSGYHTPIRGLFTGGSGNHPGGGITAGPGRLAAQALIDSLL